MYESYYGLTSKPFRLNPDPNFYFREQATPPRPSLLLNTACTRIEGFIVITGEVGAGKTTIVRGLLEGLDAEKVVAAQLVSTQLDADDTLRLVGAAFGLRTKDVAKSDVLDVARSLPDPAWLPRASAACWSSMKRQDLTARAVERAAHAFQFPVRQPGPASQSFLIGQPESSRFREARNMMPVSPTGDCCLPHWPARCRRNPGLYRTPPEAGWSHHAPRDFG